MIIAVIMFGSQRRFHSVQGGLDVLGGILQLKEPYGEWVVDSLTDVGASINPMKYEYAKFTYISKLSTHVYKEINR